MNNEKEPLAVFLENIHLIILISAFRAFPLAELLPYGKIINGHIGLLYTVFTGYMGLCLWARYYLSLNGRTEENNFIIDGFKLIWVVLGFYLLIGMTFGLPFFIYGILAGYAIIDADSMREMIKPDALLFKIIITSLSITFVVSTFFMIPLIIAGKFHPKSRYYIPKNWFKENFIILKAGFKRILPFLAMIIAYLLLVQTLYSHFSLMKPCPYDPKKYISIILFSIPWEIFFIYQIYFLQKFSPFPFRTTYPDKKRKKVFSTVDVGEAEIAAAGFSRECIHFVMYPGFSEGVELLKSKEIDRLSFYVRPDDYKYARAVIRKALRGKP